MPEKNIRGTLTKNLMSVLMMWMAFCAVSAAWADSPMPALQKAKRYTGDEAVSGWMMSEKLDGIRGYWNGRALLTRKGKKIHAPTWFVEGLPPFSLDGELWRRRDDFAFVQRTVLDEVPTVDWRYITYNIFEVPGAKGVLSETLE